MSTEILVKVLFAEGPIKAEVMHFATMKEAIANLRGEDHIIDYVLEVERDEDTRIVRSHDVSEDFEKAWLATERADLEDDFHFGLRDNNYSLETTLEQAEGPRFAKREAVQIAAE